MSLVLTVVNAWRPSLSHLQEVADFGTNPGALRMLTYVPDDVPSRPALVVALFTAWRRQRLMWCINRGDARPDFLVR